MVCNRAEIWGELRHGLPFPTFIELRIRIDMPHMSS